MQSGYAVCTSDLSKILTIAPCKTKFIFVTITTGQTLTFTGGTGSSVATYNFVEEDLRNDMIKYIDAIVYDLQYPGNHKVWKEAQKYLNRLLQQLELKEKQEDFANTCNTEETFPVL